jgi:hypothetical protein
VSEEHWGLERGILSCICTYVFVYSFPLSLGVGCARIFVGTSIFVELVGVGFRSIVSPGLAVCIGPVVFSFL